MPIPNVQRPPPVDTSRILATFKRGRSEPLGVRWFGVTSFWGHFRHLVASAIATEDVDSRDWMWPDAPEGLCERIGRLLGGGGGNSSLVEHLGRDLWIDYVADTGDDHSVSEAVARLVFAEYELPDPDREGEFLHAPRGDVLFFGGDTAYPVATVDEINNRVIVPFNRVLQEVDDGKVRVLLGIPGNHDWYDGLDGFARMFRRRSDEDAPVVRPSMLPIERPRLEVAADWAREFVRGGQIEKPKALVLIGYEAVQRASYFALPLTPELNLFALDRQLKHVDFRQRRYFADIWSRMEQANTLLMLPDPVRAFGRPSATGTAMIQALPVDPNLDRCLVVSGDIHHYERWQEGESQHVIAGGGGAFLHPQRLSGERTPKVDVEWPSVPQCRRLLKRVPWKILRGQSGILPHVVFAVIFEPIVSSLFDKDLWRAGLATVLCAIACTLALAFLGGVRRSDKRGRVLAAAFAGGLAITSLPLLATWLALTWMSGGLIAFGAALASAVLVATFAFGVFLASMTRFGLENTQAFTALDHPGFKHFLRFRVRENGEAVDVYCVGAADPLGNFQPELIDHFTWRPRARPRRRA